MNVIGVGESDVGQKRQNNEDGFHVANDRGLFIVADGMGGHRGGEVASMTAVESICRELSAEKLDQVSAEGTEAMTAAVASAVETANRDILERGSADSSLAGMGCALSMLWCKDAVGVIGHVGDTRIYLRRGGAIEQLTNDHTFAGELERAGAVSPSELKRHPQGHVLTRALGAQSDLSVETRALELRDGDRLLLCSDGLTAYAADAPSLDGHLSADAWRDIPAALVRWANEAGGRDNITAVVVEVGAGS